MSYRDIIGIEHESCAEACRYYGADNPEQLDAKAALARQQYQASAAAHAYDLRLRVEHQLWAAGMSGVIAQLEAISDETLLEYQRSDRRPFGGCGPRCPYGRTTATVGVGPI